VETVDNAVDVLTLTERCNSLVIHYPQHLLLALLHLQRVSPQPDELLWTDGNDPESPSLDDPLRVRGVLDVRNVCCEPPLKQGLARPHAEPRGLHGL